MSLINARGTIRPTSLNSAFVSGIAAFALSMALMPGSAMANGCGPASPNGHNGDDHQITDSSVTNCVLSAQDSVTIQAGGTITTTSGNAIQSSGIGISIVNAGTIATSVDINSAILRNTGTVDSFVNTGLINPRAGPGILNEALGIISVLSNDNGTISAENIAPAISNFGIISMLSNKNGVITSDYLGILSLGLANIDNTDGNINARLQALVLFGTGTINNTNGLIASEENAAVMLLHSITGPLINTGGLITTASTNDVVGALHAFGDVGNLTVLGGTVSNTNNSNNEGVAFSIGADQTGTIRFDGVHIVSDGDTPGSGHGQAMYLFEYNVSLDLNSTTIVQGDINRGNNHQCCGFINITTTAEIHGNITTGDGIDTITFNGGSMTGNIDLRGANDTLTINGGTIAGSVEFGAGLNAFNVNTDFTTGGIYSTVPGALNFGLVPIFSVLQAATDLNIASTGYLTVEHAVGLGAGAINVADGGTLFLSGGDVTATGRFMNEGTTRIGVGRTLSAGSFDAVTAGTLVFDTTSINGALATGSINLGESPANLTNQAVTINYTGGLLSNAARSLIVTGTGAAVLPLTPVVDTSLLYDFVIEKDALATNQLYLTLSQATSLETAATTDNNLTTSKVLLEELNGSSDPTIVQIQNNLVHASTQQEYNDILEATQPTVNKGDQVAAAGMTGAMFDLADGQLAMVNTAGETGVSTGNNLAGLHFWAQGFGSTANQGERGGFEGYDAHVVGLGIGVDTRNLHKDVLVGLSFGQARTNVRSENANRTDTDVDSYQLMAYGNYELGGDGFLTAMALYGWNGNDQTRHDVGGIGGLEAKADYDSWVSGTKLSAGHNFYVGKGVQGGLKLTPQLFSEYVHFNRGDYTETGVGGADLVIGSVSQDVLNLGVSLQAEWTFKTGGGTTIKPDLHAGYKYDVLDDQADTTTSFVAGGSTFAVGGMDTPNSTFAIGAGAKFYSVDNWDFSANYDYTFKSDYAAHSGLFRAAYEF